MSLNELRDRAFATAKAHGFTEASVPEDIALMHSELSEALEDYRKGLQPATFVYDRAKALRLTVADDWMAKPCGIPSELADVVIRILHFCGKHEIDLERAVLEKMAYNDLRPFKHGKTI